MIRIIFFVVCYLAIGYVIQLLGVILSNVLGINRADATNTTMRELGLDNLADFDEDDAEELLEPNKMYLWINIFVWPINMLMLIYFFIHILYKIIRNK